MVSSTLVHFYCQDHDRIAVGMVSANRGDHWNFFVDHNRDLVFSPAPYKHRIFVKKRDQSHSSERLTVQFCVSHSSTGSKFTLYFLSGSVLF